MSVDRRATLAVLTAQARQEGVSLVTLQALVEEASQTGAHRALTELGLADGAAGKDIMELRQLISAWRDVQRSARKTVVEWLVRLLLVALVIGLAAKFKLLGTFR